MTGLRANEMDKDIDLRASEPKVELGLGSGWG